MLSPKISAVPKESNASQTLCSRTRRAFGTRGRRFQSFNRNSGPPLDNVGSRRQHLNILTTWIRFLFRIPLKHQQPSRPATKKLYAKAVFKGDLNLHRYANTSIRLSYGYLRGSSRDLLTRKARKAHQAAIVLVFFTVVTIQQYLVFIESPRFVALSLYTPQLDQLSIC